MYLYNLLGEAFVVGLITTIIGILISIPIEYLFDIQLVSFTDWKKHHAIEAAFFATGFLTHLMLQAIGLNRWYCNNGYACSQV